MSDDKILFRELRAMLESDSGKRRFCGAILGKGQAFLANANSLRIAIMATMPYRVYMTTEHWRTTSTTAKERAGNRCQLCNSPKNIQSHHRTYERRGHELPEDLTVLCDECHGKFHTKPTPDEQIEPATSDPMEMRFAAMTDEEQMECLQEMIVAKRRQFGLDKRETVTPKPNYSTVVQNLKQSRVCSSTPRK